LGTVYKYAEHNKLKILEGVMAKVIGEILMYLAGQHVSEAEDWIQEAIDVDYRNDTRFSLVENYDLPGEAILLGKTLIIELLKRLEIYPVKWYVLNCILSYIH